MNTLALLLCAITLAQSPNPSDMFPRDVRNPLETFESVSRFLRLPDPPKTPVDPRPISLARLTHKVPKKAQEAFARATTFGNKQQHAEAVLALEQAVAIDPAFADAYNNLGVQHFLQRHLVESETALRRAIELDPAFATAHINLAYLALTKNDSATANQEAQRALALGDQDGEAQKVLEVLRARPL
ncbi:MAG: tetratricopeptide repeat protein [Bryobacteraceae bacterium]